MIRNLSALPVLVLCASARSEEQRAILFPPAPPPSPLAACKTDAPAPHAILFFVDPTDRLSTIDQARARDMVDRLTAELPAGSRFVLAALNRDNPDEPVVLFNGCTPGSRVAPGELTGKNYQRRKYEIDFAKPLAAALDMAFAEKPGSPSPIIENFSAAMRLPELSAANAEKRSVFVLSDLLQVGSSYDQLHITRKYWEAFQRSPLASRLRPDLSGANVRILYIERAAYAAHQNADQRAFWTRWFTEAGAASVAFDGAPPDRVQSSNELTDAKEKRP